MAAAARAVAASRAPSEGAAGLRGTSQSPQRLLRRHLLLPLLPSSFTLPAAAAQQSSPGAGQRPQLLRYCWGRRQRRRAGPGRSRALGSRLPASAPAAAAAAAALDQEAAAPTGRRWQLQLGLVLSRCAALARAPLSPEPPPLRVPSLTQSPL